MRYKASKDVQVSSVNSKAEVISISFKTGKYETKDPDEIALLDELATSKASPIGHDPTDRKGA